jgi:pimeloyl-ACP methyl ester carboxylesterase
MSGKHAATRHTFRYSDAVQINYEMHGHGGTPIVFLHGFAAALTTWRDITPLFPPELATLYLLDLKGFGFSSKPRDRHYTVEEQAAIVIAFLEHEGLSNVVLAGHSLGGGIALLAYLTARGNGKGNLIGRLLLIACSAYPQRLPWIMRLLRNRLLGRAILNLLPLRFMVRFSLAHLIHDRRAITTERIARYMGCFGRKGIAPVFIETCRQLIPERYGGLTGLYRSITCPTLIIWGGADPVISPRQGLRLHGEIAGSHLLVIPDCGHIPQEERPAETYAAIRNFLEGFSPAR